VIGERSPRDVAKPSRPVRCSPLRRAASLDGCGKMRKGPCVPRCSLSGYRRQGYYKAFPPAGIEVVSWYVMMGIGQVITLQVPAERLREVNVAIEKQPGADIGLSFIRPTTTRPLAR